MWEAHEQRHDERLAELRETFKQVSKGEFADMLAHLLEMQVELEHRVADLEAEVFGDGELDD